MTPVTPGEQAALGAPASALFESTAIRSMTLANRFVRSATWEGMADDEGRPTPMLTRLYADLARGRVGLIITSHAFVVAEGKAIHQQLGVHDDAMIAPLRGLSDAVHAAGARSPFNWLTVDCGRWGARRRVAPARAPRVPLSPRAPRAPPPPRPSARRSPRAPQCGTPTPARWAGR